MNYDDLLELVKNRRSTRIFKTDPVPEGCIEKIIEVARWAPSGFNLQPWEFMIITDQKLKGSIVQFCREGMANVGRMEAIREEWQGVMKFPAPPPPDSGNGDYSAAPVFILLFGDTRTNAGLPMYRRYDEALKREAFKGGLANTFLYMHLAAASLNLGSQWVSAVTNPYAHSMIKNLLGIPLEFEVYDMMALGYPAMPAKPRPVRDLKEMLHYNTSGPDSFRTDEQVKDFIRKIRS